ncbi:MAG: thioredoxin domain-containing protein [Chloroflexi bacterium]|nr:thioredoxin domain-containing protein [Chloroflexota bacterium]
MARYSSIVSCCNCARLGALSNDKGLNMYRAIKTIFIALLALVSAALVNSQPASDPYADIPKSRAEDGAFVLGQPEARVKLIEFSDFLCTSCQNYKPIIETFIQEYVETGQAQFEYRIYPVIDPELSVRSASLVECADTQRPGQFWRARDLMFGLVSTQGYTDESIAEFAAELQIDPLALSDCADNAVQHEIDARYGLSLGASATPSLFVKYGDSAPTPLALALPEHHFAIVNAIRPSSTDPVQINHGRYAGLETFRRADGGFVLGSPDAPITIVAFEDFLCPHCQHYQTNVDTFVEEYVRSGAAQFEFRFYPLVNPQYSTAFAKTAECVAAQNLTQFWDAHDLLFEFARRGTLDDIAGKVADLLDLDGNALSACLDRSIQFLVDTQLGQPAFVSGTPAVRARRNGGALELIYLGEQPIDRGAPTIFQLRSLMENSGEASIGPPQLSLINERFLADTSLLTGEPCGPPCWQGIVPGQSTLAEALDIVNALDGIAVMQQAEGAFQFGKVNGPPCCQISADETQVVSAIILQFAPEMTVGEALERHGEPLFFRGQPYTDTEAILWFYYPDQFTMIQVIVPGVEGALDANSPLVAAYYLTELDMSDALEAGIFSPWKGYVSYREYTE